MFNVENGAVDSVKEIETEDKTLKIEESVVTYKVIEGEDSQTEWLRLCLLIGEMGKNKSKKSTRGSGRGFRGKRGSGRGRKGNWKPADRKRGDGGGEKVELEKSSKEEDCEKVVLGKRSNEEEEQPKAKHVRMTDSD